MQQPGGSGGGIPAGIPGRIPAGIPGGVPDEHQVEFQEAPAVKFEVKVLVVVIPDEEKDALKEMEGEEKSK